MRKIFMVSLAALFLLGANWAVIDGNKLRLTRQRPFTVGDYWHYALSVPAADIDTVQLPLELQGVDPESLYPIIMWVRVEAYADPAGPFGAVGIQTSTSIRPSEFMPGYLDPGILRKE